MQSILEETIGRVTQEKVRVVGSGRTDAGAHAFGQVVAFTTGTRLSGAVLQRALNATLPRDVALTSLRDVAPDFHPRFDAQSRTYRYVIHNRPVRSPFWEGRALHIGHRLDDRVMHTAEQELVGRHDFGAFVPSAFSGSRIRTMYEARCRRDGDLVVTELRADGFMRQMVRSMVGTLIRVGAGRLEQAELRSILESRDRRLAAETAPACGLYLVAVHYPQGLMLPERSATPRGESDVPALYGSEEKA